MPGKHLPKGSSAYGVASDRVYICTQSPAVQVSSYLTFPSLPSFDLSKRGGLFLLHFPWSRLRRSLSVILPCEARTFLTPIPFGPMVRGSLLFSYYILYRIYPSLSNQFCIIIKNCEFSSHFCKNTHLSN